jgi:hypothetical protein
VGGRGEGGGRGARLRPQAGRVRGWRVAAATRPRPGRRVLLVLADPIRLIPSSWSRSHWRRLNARRTHCAQHQLQARSRAAVQRKGSARAAERTCAPRLARQVGLAQQVAKAVVLNLLPHLLWQPSRLSCASGRCGARRFIACMQGVCVLRQRCCQQHRVGPGQHTSGHQTGCQAAGACRCSSTTPLTPLPRGTSSSVHNEGKSSQ